MLVQLHTPVPLDTPRGPAFAHLVIDYGSEFHLIWVCFLNATGAVLVLSKPGSEIAEANPTMGVRDAGQKSQSQRRKLNAEVRS